MVIEVYSGFSKKHNSTKQPAGSGTQISVHLKENTSVLNPHFLVHDYSFSHNYLKWGVRYYYIEDIVSISNDMCEYICRYDALATFKNNIGASSQYILRAASAFNGRVIDQYYPTKAQNVHDADIITSPFDKNAGMFVIGIQGKGAGANGGAVTYYAGDKTAVKALVNYMLSSPSSYQVSDISQELLTCIFNPMQFIVSCMWFPFAVPVVNGDLSVGWWNVSDIDLKPIAALEWGTNFSFNIPKHPKAASRGQYLNMQPFSRYNLECGPWGVIPLDNFNLIDSSQLDCDFKVDLMTGSGRLNIKYRDKLIYENVYTTQIGVPVQLGQNVLNQGALTGAVNGGVSMIQSAITGSPSGMLLNGLAAIGDAAALSQGVPSMMGSNGTISFNNIFGLMADFIDVVDDNIVENGRPLCEVRTISSLSGYILCQNADLDLSASPAEKDEIITYLNEGFYYE